MSLSTDPHSSKWLLERLREFDEMNTWQVAKHFHVNGTIGVLKPHDNPMHRRSAALDQQHSINSTRSTALDQQHSINSTRSTALRSTAPVTALDQQHSINSTPYQQHSMDGLPQSAGSAGKKGGGWDGSAARLPVLWACNSSRTCPRWGWMPSVLW
jgi:hypothetical protein